MAVAPYRYPYSQSRQLKPANYVGGRREWRA